MSQLFFQCPVTGKEFPSQINTDPESLLRIANLPVTLACPLCGDVHRMTAKHGRLRQLDIRNPPVGNEESFRVPPTR
jgi:hypothetical protein